MRSFTVTENDRGRRLDRFVAANAPKLPKSLLYKYVRTKRIKVNGKKCEIDRRLEKGDLVEMYIGDEFFAPQEQRYDFLNAPRSLDVVYEDDNILIADKKAGVLSHPDAGEYVDTLITRVRRYLYEKGEYDPAAENAFAPALANRIDRNTGGLVIACKNAEALRSVCDAIRDRRIGKKYLCVVIGRPPKREDTVTLYTIKDEKKNLALVYDAPRPGAKTMVTGYRALDARDGLTLCDVTLHTGRTHQIRATFAHLGCPLLGDGKYGRREDNKRFGGYKKQCLYAYALTFRVPPDDPVLGYLSGKTVEATSIWFRDAFYDGTLVR